MSVFGDGTTAVPYQTNESFISSVATVTTPSPFPSSRRLLLGVVLAVTGNLLISVAMNIQVAVMLYIILPAEYLCQILFLFCFSTKHWCGLLLMVLGEVGNFSAYGFAPASLVAPLGTTTVIVNAIIAVLFLKEKIRYRDVFGISLSIIGAFLLVNFSTKTDTMLTAHEIMKNLKQWQFLVYLSVEVIVFVALVYANYVYNFAKVVTILLQVAILGSFTVITAKAVSSMLTITLRGYNQFVYPIFYVMLIVMVATAVGQVRFLNQAMASHDTTVVVPTNFVFFTMAAILSGIVFYQEFYGLTFLEIFMFLFGASLSFAGVYLITGARKEVDLKTTNEESKELLPSTDAKPTVIGKIQRVQPDDHELPRDIFLDETGSVIKSEL